MDEILKQYDGMIAALATSLYTPNRIYSSDDLAQEGRMSLIKRIHKYKPERSKLSTFITVCARNDMLKFINKQSRHLRSHLQIHPFDRKNIAYYPDEVVRDSKISSSESVSRMIDLKMEGHSDTYIAKEMKSTVANVRMRIKKALST